MTNYTTKTSNNLKDLTNQRFGRLIVSYRVKRPIHLKGRSAYWKCICDCGNTLDVSANSLRQGRTSSCGCWHKECAAQTGHKTSTHGLRHTPEYQTWAGMKDRCYNIKCKRFSDWGGRGIVVCDQWKNNFENFYADMGPRPSKNHSIDRIDNDGPYSPENCQWATRSQQNKNQRKPKPSLTSRRITYKGKTQTISEWAKEVNLSTVALRHRIERGWTVEEALLTPLNT